MAELLFEILCEEIPAGMQVRAGANLAKALTDGLTKAGLDVNDTTVLTGPRRLVFTADMPLRSPDIKEERKGPRVGAPEQDLAGFMRGAGLSDISEAEKRTDKKGEFYVAMIEKQGRDAAEVLAELIPDVMNSFPWPKSMKSGTSNFRWVRPLQSLLCLLDGNVVKFEVGGFATGNTTEGHRRLGRGPFTIKDFADYKNKLETKGHVVLSAEDRKAIIVKDAEAACKKAGLELVDDPGLLDEVAGLVEYPVIILGDMDPSFLKLPGEVIRLSMRSHQKYFAVRDPKTGDLAPKFIVVANQIAPDGGKAIATGNSRVLSARLDDARFFQAEDAKRTLESRFDDLDGVVFHQKLGTIKDKVERVSALARELAPIVGSDPKKAEKAAKLAKCDLVTNMVVEFTSLQGQIGRLMYEAEGGDKDIALAIEDHYRPQGPADKIPTNPVAISVALADKLDTLVGFWAIDEKPTGSKDPYALRRAALGVVRVILENNIRFRLSPITLLSFDKLFTRLRKHSMDISQSYEMWVARAFENDEEFDLDGFYAELSNMLGDNLCNNFKDYQIFPPEAEKSLLKNKIDAEYRIGQIEILLAYLVFSDTKKYPEPLEELIDRDWNKKVSSSLQVAFYPILLDLRTFIRDRLKVHLREEGVRHDLIDAVFALGEDDLVAVVNRVEALQSFLATEDGTNLLAGYKRAANILKAEAKKGDLPEDEPNKGTQAEETALFDALGTAKPAIEKALSKEDYAGAMTALSKLRAPIDAFFDEVTVNADDADQRNNRLALLMDIRKTARTIADFNKIEG